MDQEQTQTPAPQQSQSQEGDNSKLAAVLSYIGPLVIVSYIIGKDNAFAKFHIRQGLVLFVAEVALWILGMVLFMLWPLIYIVNLGLFILSIIGIINAVHGKEKELPITGKYAKHFNI